MEQSLTSSVHCKHHLSRQGEARIESMTSVFSTSLHWSFHYILPEHKQLGRMEILLCRTQSPFRALPQVKDSEQLCLQQM